VSTSIENGRPGEFHAALWLIRPGTPRFYPDAVTTAGVEAAPAQLEALADLIGSNRRREWFVKDGYHCLRLEQLGFEPLFDAEWIAMCSTRPHAGHHQPGDRSTIVTDEAGLSAWERPRVGENTKAIGSDEMDYRGEKIRLSKTVRRLRRRQERSGQPCSIGDFAR
jgi:hypothetical protein